MTTIPDTGDRPAPWDHLSGAAWRRHPPDGDGPVIGVIGRDVPLELIDAAGARPFTLQGDPTLDTTGADHYLGTGLDPAARSILAVLLDGGLGHLDAIVACTDSEGSSRLYYLLRELARVDPGAGVPPLHLVDVLHRRRPSSLRYTTRQVAGLSRVLAGWTGRPMTDRSLAEAVEERNEVRRHLQAIDALRGELRPRLSGSDLLTARAASGRLPAAVALPLLAAAVEAVMDGAGPITEPGPVRLLLTGSAHHEPAVTATIEGAGGAVVADDHPTGALGSGLLCRAPTIQAVAERAWADGGTPQRASSAERAAATARLASERRVDLVLAYARRHDEAPLWDAAAQRAALRVPLVLLPDQGHGAIDRPALTEALARTRHAIGSNHG